MRACLASLALIAAPPAFAQPPLVQTMPPSASTAVPRTIDGRPDFSGGWATRIMTPLERPDGVPDLIVPHDKEAEIIAKITPKIGEVFDPEFSYAGFTDNLLEINGELRSSLIIEPADGKLPLTSLARAILDNAKPSFDDPERRPSNERCIGGTVQAPIGATSFVIPFHIVQTPQHLAFIAEDMEPIRIVSMSGLPPPDALRSRTGHSRGRWEGDTLIVETDHFGFSDHEGMIFHGETPVTADSRVVERLRLLSPDEFLYQFTIEDASLYKTPWLAEYTLQRTPRGVYEYACHEGNHALGHILGAARLGKQEEKKSSN